MSLIYGLLPDTNNSLLEFKEFHNLLFKNTDVTYEWLEWYIRRIPLSHRIPTRIYTLRDQGRLVGSWCVEPKDLRLNGENVKVGRCFSVGIHPDYRRRNLFVELSKFAIESERELRQYEYILGFPQVGRPVVEAHLKSGWERVQIIDAYGKIPSKDCLTSLRYSGFVDSLDHWDSPKQLEGAFDESGQYLDLRWIKHPDLHYMCMMHSNAHIVAKIYGSTCHILAMRGETEHVAVLLDSLNTLAYRHRWTEITTWSAANSTYVDVIKNKGYDLNPKGALSVELLAARIKASNPLELKVCNFQMGSEEGY